MPPPPLNARTYMHPLLTHPTAIHPPPSHLTAIHPSHFHNTPSPPPLFYARSVELNRSVFFGTIHDCEPPSLTLPLVSHSLTLYYTLLYLSHYTTPHTLIPLTLHPLIPLTLHTLSYTALSYTLGPWSSIARSSSALPTTVNPPRRTSRS